jgi:hypothetical protein
LGKLGWGDAFHFAVDVLTELAGNVKARVMEKGPKHCVVTTARDV